MAADTSGGSDRTQHRPFTPRELSAVERGQFGRTDGIVRRLVATIRQLEGRNFQERIDELARRIEPCWRSCVDRRNRAIITACSSWLIVVTRFEVRSDPQVRVAVACLPENKTTEEYERSLEWALWGVSSEFRSMPNEALRPTIYSTRCMSRERFEHYRTKRRMWNVIDQLEGEIEGLKRDRVCADDGRETEATGQDASGGAAATNQPPAAEAAGPGRGIFGGA